MTHTAKPVKPHPVPKLRAHSEVISTTAKSDTAKTTGIVARGAGAATKGKISRGPMG